MSNVRRCFILLTLVCLAPAAIGQDATTVDPLRVKAIAAKDALFKQLSTELISAMSKGGPSAAIEVCRLKAPRIAAAVGKQHGVSIGRTSFRLRNSKNMPPSWAETLVEQKSDEVHYVALDDQALGALFPIRLKAQCLACHGPKDQLAADVQARLAELYPQDRATGFKEGDLRGWFWVEVPGEKSP